MFVYLENAFVFVRLHMLAKVEHVLRLDGEVKLLGYVEMVANAALYGRTPPFGTVVGVAVLGHIAVVEAVSHYDVRFHEPPVARVLERIEHHAPTYVGILPVAHGADARGEIISEPLGIEPVMKLQAVLSAHARTHLLPIAVVESAHRCAHAQREEPRMGLLNLERSVLCVGNYCRGEQGDDEDERMFHGAAI